MPNSFRCNTYRKQGSGACMPTIPIVELVVSSRREPVGKRPSLPPTAAAQNETSPRSCLESFSIFFKLAINSLGS